MLKKVGIIGAGVVGTAVAAVLAEHGFEITGVCDTDPESTNRIVQLMAGISVDSAEAVSRSADILFITTKDGAIEQVVNYLTERKAFHDQQIVIHMSGAHSSELLAGSKAFGAIAISMHPLQTFADVQQAIKNLPGSMFSIEGDEPGFAAAVSIIEALGGDYFYIDSSAKPFYHAGACVVSNYLVTLADFGVSLLNHAGVERETAFKAYMPLIEGTVNNLRELGLPKALTGPIARGDKYTVISHLDSLRKTNENLLKLYCQLGFHTVPLACEKGGISPEDRQDWQQLFQNLLDGGSLKSTT